MGVEIEYKLLCEEARILEEVFQSPFVAPYLESPPRRKVLRAFYIDTPDLRLAGHGMAYRVRREDAQWVAAVKIGRKITPDGLTIRGEWERHIPRPVADPGVFRGLEVFDRLISVLGKAPLTVLFETFVTRTLGSLSFPDGTRVELAADRGEIRCGDRKERIQEIELELKAGEKTRLTALSERLQAQFPVVPGTKSKYVRGMALWKEAGCRKCPVAAEYLNLIERRTA